MIAQAEPTDYSALVKFYRRNFKIHNIFQRPEQEVLSYLMSQGTKYPVYIFKDKIIRGAVVLVNNLSSSDSHKVWKLRHFVFDSQKIGKELLEFSEKEIKKHSNTAKIEITVSVIEELFDFLAKQGYEREGTLKNHYRWGEDSFVFSKSFGKLSR